MAGTEIRVERLAAIVLAAGAGSRLGGAKLSRPFGGGLLVDGAIRAALASPARRIVMVTGSDPGLADRAAFLAEEAGRADALILCECPGWREGLSASLKSGIEVAGDIDAALVFLGDMPFIPTGLAAELVQAVAGREAKAAAPIHLGRRGHPVLLTRALLDELDSVVGDKGAGALLQGLGDQLALVPSDDPGVLADIDTPEDLKA